MVKTNDLMAPTAPFIPLYNAGDEFAGVVTYVGEPTDRHNEKQGQVDTEIKVIVEIKTLELSDSTVEDLEDNDKTPPEEGGDGAVGLRTHVDGNKRVHPLARAIFVAMAEAGLDDTDDLEGCTLAVERGKDEKVKGIKYPTYTATVTKPKARRGVSVADLTD